MIYFVRGTRSGMVKIGATENLKQRIGALRTASPEPLEVLAVMEGGATEERQMHERFAAARAAGEWFNPHADLIRFIGGLAQHDPREHPAISRRSTRRLLVHDQRRREDLEAVRLAAAHHGLSERAWYDRYVWPLAVQIARSQLVAPDPSDATPTLETPSA